MMKRICVDCRPLQRRGAGIYRYTYEMVRALSKRDDVELVLISNRDIYLDEVVVSKAIVHIDKLWSKVPGTVWFYIRGNYLAKKYNCNIIWGTQHALPPKKLNNVIYIVTWHDLVNKIFPQTMSVYNRMVMNAISRKTVESSDIIVCVSESTRSDLEKFYPLARVRNISVIYEGKSLDDIPSSFSEKVSMLKPFLFFLGSLEPRKNLVSVVRAMNYLVKLMPEIRLVVAGSKGWKAGELFRELERIRDYIFLTGYLSDQEVIDYFCNASLFVLPSLYEGFGLPLLEAEGKCSVLVNDIPVFREMRMYFENINFCNFSAHPESVASDIFNVLLNPSKLNFKKGYRNIFTWEYAAERFVSLINC